MAVYNFCAGPAMLPAEVMAQAKAEFLDWQGHGVSVMEISHRSQAYIDMAATAEQDLRELLAVPDNYRVLFMHGGGRGQFSAIPLNLTRPEQSSDHIISGQWSEKAEVEAAKYLHTRIAGRSYQNDQGLWCLPAQYDLDPNAAYVHYCPNETIDGLEFHTIPDTGNVPLAADMSSTIMSRPLDVSKFGVIYAGAQKNIGPSGLAVAIVRDDLIGHARQQCPSIFDYGLTAKHDSMYNTPPTYAWYLAGLVFKWLKKQGGLNAMEAHNRAKSDLLYGFIDDHDFYSNQVDPQARSWMNVPFQLADASLDATFLAEAEQAGLKALKGHRSVGGMRASIYNAMPLAGVQTLVDFMADFARRHG